MTDQPISVDLIQRAFPGIRVGEAEEMISSGDLLTFPKDTIICQEGEVGRTFYVIVEGRVSVTKQIRGADVRLLTHLVPGDYFGEMAIIHDAPRAATITTTEETKVLVIQQDAFARMLEHSRSMSLDMVRKVSQRLRENDEMAIDEMRAKNRELAEAYEELARQEQARREFLTTIAHELRTPLMTANGFLQVIRMGGMKGEALDSGLETVARNIQEIITLTNDILFVQEMDMILPEFNSTDVGSVVATAVDKQRGKAEANEVGFNLNIASGLPKIQAESKSLERAMNAILDNAIKFSPEGGDVYIDVLCEDNELVVKIQDHGVGIAEDVLPQIFNRFFHVDKMGDHLFRGAGLGLSIARQAISLHKGKIEVESKLGEGSRFIIRLPVNGK